jgi:hypothetical protein
MPRFRAIDAKVAGETATRDGSGSLPRSLRRIIDQLPAASLRRSSRCASLFSVRHRIRRAWSDDGCGRLGGRHCAGTRRLLSF